MINDYINQFKKIWYTPSPVVKPSEVISTGLKVVLLFGVFYFAIFSFTAPLERIKRDLIEFISVGFSLFCSWLIFRAISEIYSKITKRRLFPTFGYSLLEFLIIYSMMIGILYLIKLSIYGSGKSWIWRYYWRHLPYAFLIFSVYIYRENKNAVIKNLIKKLNLRLENTERKEIKPEDTNHDESPLSLQVDGRNRKLLPSHISHISVDGHYLDIYHQKEETTEHILIRKPLTEMLEELPKPPFLRIHRSHIVNLNYISELKKMKRRYSVNLCDKQFSIPISRSNLSNFLSYLEHTSKITS